MARFYPQPLSQLPSLPPKSIIHFLFYLLFTWSSKSEANVLSPSSCPFASAYYLQIPGIFSKVTSFVRISHLDISFHLFTSVTTGSSHIAALPKPISGVPPNQDQASEKWTNEQNYEKQMMKWNNKAEKNWWKYKNSKETGTVPTLNSSSNFQTLDTLFPCCKAPISLALLLCHVTICAMTYVHMSLSLTCKLQKKMHGFHWSIRKCNKCNTQNKLMARFARSKSMARTLLPDLPAFESMK